MRSAYYISHLLVGIVLCLKLTYAKDAHKVHCSEELMRVEIGLPKINNQESSTSEGNNSTTRLNSPLIHHENEPEARVQIYLEGLKGYPDERCQPLINGSLAIFHLSLSDFYECGVTRMINQLTGRKVYYHKIVIESFYGKELISVKCVISGPKHNVMLNETHLAIQLHNQQKQYTLQRHDIVRRDVLPIGFQEPEDLEITTSLTERAPEPRLSIGVSQNGKEVNGDLTVTPGTPLTMEIKLDRNSALVYGLGVNYLEVTDTRLLSETIIFKGCTVDPYLFENFNTIDGDTLNAKFKAFKFPDSSYVQFRATVNVCLDKCLGTQCSNGQIGYGRKKRNIIDSKPMPLIDNNKVFEISLTMFIKVEDLVEGANKNEVLRLEEKLRELKMVNQRLARNSRHHFAEPLLNTKTVQKLPLTAPAFVVDESEAGSLTSGAAIIFNLNSFVATLIPPTYGFVIILLYKFL